MTTPIADRIAEIRKREQAATKGPWEEFSAHVFKGDFEIGQFNQPDGDAIQPDEEANAAFIAAARSDVPRLLAALELAIQQRNNARWRMDKNFDEKIEREQADDAELAAVWEVGE